MVANTASAHEEIRIEAAWFCSTVTDNLARLYCFDRAFPQSDGAPADEAPADPNETDALEPTTP